MSRAGILASNFPLTNIQRLISLYYEVTPNLSDPLNAVVFGTSGHRGSPNNGSYTQSHIAAITQAIADLRKEWQITGPLFIGMDTHALSEPALHTALEVLCANGVETVVANLRIGHRYQLTRIGRIGQNLFIAGHAGVEYYFALAVYRRADTVPG